MVVTIDLDIPTLHLIRMPEIDQLTPELPTAIMQMRHLLEVHLLLREPLLPLLPLLQLPLILLLLSLRLWLCSKLKSPS